MGSAMSFPLLCLINKAVVDLSLADLLETKKIGWTEFVQHRCLINGDDLLLREPKVGSDILKQAVIRNGGEVGLIVNEDKSGVSAVHAEINSTMFERSTAGWEKKKKTNGNSLYMSPDVQDVLGVAFEGTRTKEGFIRVVRANAKLLAEQEDKLLWKLPFSYQAAARKDKKIKKSLLVSPPASQDDQWNLFPVVSAPEGYEMTHEETKEILTSEVDRVRKNAIELQKAKSMKAFCQRKGVTDTWAQFTFGPRKVKKPIPHGKSWRSLIKKKKGPVEEKVLRCLAEAYLQKKKERLVREEVETTSAAGIFDLFHDISLYPSAIQYLTELIRVDTPKSCLERLVATLEMILRC